jgi:hypothetical protein
MVIVYPFVDLLHNYAVFSTKCQGVLKIFLIFFHLFEKARSATKGVARKEQSEPPKQPTRRRLFLTQAAIRDSYLSARGQSPYQRDIYWTSDQTDIEGAYAYDFSSGMHLIDHKANRYRVMCIQSETF